jgi:ACR3 family arsenite transporter
VSAPIAVRLLLMMHPVLAKVRYEDVGAVAGERRLTGTSPTLSRLFGPLPMLTLAWLSLTDQRQC